MHVARRTLAVLLFAVPLAVLTLVSVRVVRLYFRGAERNLAPALSSEMTDSLQHEVAIGGARISANRVYLDSVRIAEGRTFAERGPIASARRVVLDYDLYNLLFGRSPAVPQFSRATVVDPTVRVSRSAAGVWNFVELFRPRRPGPSRTLAGLVEVSGADLYYSDRALLHNAQRPAAPVAAHFQGVSGRIVFRPDQSVSWKATGREVTGQAGAATVTGTYVRANRHLLIDIAASDVSAPLVNRLLPLTSNLTAGRASGTVSLASTPDLPGAPRLDYQANVRVQGVALVARGLAEPIRGLSGVATTTAQVSTLKLDGDWAGSRMHVEGTVLGPLSSPVLDGWVLGQGVQLARVLEALGLSRRFPQLRQLAATGNVRAVVRGPARNLSVQAQGPVRVSGSLPGGVAAPVAGIVQVSLSGPVASPRVVATGSLPTVRLRGYEARNVWFSGVWSRSQAAADFTGQIAGGRVTGRAFARPGGGRSAYSLVARARGLDLARIPWTARQRRQRPQPPEPRIGGTADADVAADGILGTGLPSGRALVQVSGLKWNKWRAEEAQASVASRGDVLDVQSLALRDPVGTLAAAGTVNLRRRTIDLRVDADDVALAKLPEAPGSGGAGASGPGSAPQPAIASGWGYMRDGRLTGTWDDPRLAGRVRAYDLLVGSVAIDVVSAHIGLDRRTLDIADGTVYRLPAVAHVEGSVVDPFSPDARVSLRGSVRELDLKDVAEMAGSDLRVLGTASGPFEVVGPLSRPAAVVSPITVANASLNDLDFTGVTGALRYEPSDAGGTWRLDGFSAGFGTATLSGSARLDPDRRFHVDGRIEHFELARLNPSVLPYVVLTGTAEAGGSLDGVLRAGKAEDLVGHLTGSTAGLTVNGQGLGQARADIAMADGSITPATVVLGPEGAPVARITGISYDRDTGTVTASGTADGVAFDTLRRLALGSPWVVGRPRDPVSRWLQEPGANEPRGSVDLAFAVKGTVDEPAFTVSWKNGGDLSIGSRTIQRFEGTADFGHGETRLSDVAVQSGSMSLSGSGLLSAGDRVAADVTGTDVSLDAVREWALGVKDVQGGVGHVAVHVAGALDALVLEVTADRADVTWPLHPATGTATAHVSVGHATFSQWSPSAQTGGLRLSDALLAVDTGPTGGAGAAVPGPRAGQYTVEVPDAVLEVYLRKPPDFHDDIPPLLDMAERGPMLTGGIAPFIPGDPVVGLHAVVPRQRLEVLAATFPGTFAEAGGTANADLHWTGRLREPSITGSLALSQAPSERIRLKGVLTALADADVALGFSGDLMTVSTFTVRPVSNVAGRSDPITVTGALALRGEAPSSARLQIEAPRVRVYEQPLPSFGSGRLVASALSATVTVGGTLMKPALTGLVEVADADLRLPDKPVQGQAGVVLPLGATFDVALAFGNNVRVASSQMSAVVRTEPNAPVMIAGSLSDPSVRGTLIAESGSLVFPTARFALQPGGDIELRYPYYAGIENRAPQYVLGVIVNVTATTHLTATSVTGEVKRYTVFVEASGPINGAGATVTPSATGFGALTGAGPGLRLTFRSDPPDLSYSQVGLQQRVTELLGGQAAISGLFSSRPDIGRLVGQQLTDILSANLFPDVLERLGIARTLGFQELAVEYSTTDAFALRVSRHLFGPLYVSYWQRLSGVAREAGARDFWEFKLSYTLRHNLQFSWTTNDQRTNAYLLEGVYRF